MSEEKEDNLIKQVCKELDLTYAELAEKIGFTEGAIKNSVSSGKMVNCKMKLKRYKS